MSRAESLPRTPLPSTHTSSLSALRLPWVPQRALLVPSRLSIDYRSLVLLSQTFSIWCCCGQSYEGGVSTSYVFVCPVYGSSDLLLVPSKELRQSSEQKGPPSDLGARELLMMWVPLRFKPRSCASPWSEPPPTACWECEFKVEGQTETHQAQPLQAHHTCRDHGLHTFSSVFFCLKRSQPLTLASSLALPPPPPHPPPSSRA